MQARNPLPVPLQAFAAEVKRDVPPRRLRRLTLTVTGEVEVAICKAT